MPRHILTTGRIAVTTIGFAVAIPVLGGLPQAAAAPNVCVSVNGHQGPQLGTASCESSGRWSISIARGDNAHAEATGNFNRAAAIGNDSQAYAEDGTGNTATAKGNGARAYASGGVNNTASAIGDGSTAAALAGSKNTATATGFGSRATSELGDGNVVTAKGANTYASIFNGSDNRVTAGTPGCQVDVSGQSGQTRSC